MGLDGELHVEAISARRSERGRGRRTLSRVLGDDEHERLRALGARLAPRAVRSRRSTAGAPLLTSASSRGLPVTATASRGKLPALSRCSAA